MYENHAPVWICDIDSSHKDLTWHKFKNEYLKLHEVKENWLEEKHKVSCVLGWFCHLYNKKFKVDYVFVPQNTNPFSSLECKTAQILIATFDGDALKVRDYLKWLIGKELRTEITSIGYLKTPGIVRKYMLLKEAEKIKTRTSILPEDFLKWCKQETNILDNYTLTNLNDLVSLANYVKANNIGGEEIKVLEQAEKLELIHNGKIKN